MPIPLAVIGAALAAGALVKVAKAALRNEDARHGYCTWCGSEDARHDFHEDGLSWKKTGPIAVLTGGIGTAIAGLVSRNIYRCACCGKLTLPCRMPGCSGMARSTDIYDDEFCGRCVDSNNVHAERAAKERTEADRDKLAQLLQMHEKRVRALEHELAKLRRARGEDAGRIQGLLAVIKRDRETIRQLRRMLGLPKGARS